MSWVDFLLRHPETVKTDVSTGKPAVAPSKLYAIVMTIVPIAVGLYAAVTGKNPADFLPTPPAVTEPAPSPVAGATAAHDDSAFLFTSGATP